MDSGPIQRTKWEIDRVLDGLVGENVRVAAESFSPAPLNANTKTCFRSVGKLFLPDNSQPGSLPVYFEGRLEQFERRVGLVFVWLGSPTVSDGAAEGTTYFRGKIAVFLRGPAIVHLAWPFQVERLPTDTGNYWRDLRMPVVQFEFPFTAEAQDVRACDSAELPTPVDAPPGLHSAECSKRRFAPIDFDSPNAVDGVVGKEVIMEERCPPQPGANDALIHNLNCSRSTG